uniref:RRM domain-containing protein n=1 Tax=Gossypium raimondii TaxID=29730 RepID=A0A0D2P1H3_GOSRA|nr:hypothetical protein B456_007G017000 [Gossypium raimondii]
MSGRFSRTIYVGNLPSDIREWEVEDLFYKYGRILDIELKIPLRPPCFCFVEFEDPRDAEDAIRGRDGYNFDGCRLRVELAHGGRGQSSSDRRGGYGGAAAKFGVSRHSDYRVIVRGLPSSASWQDLKISKLDDTEFRNPWARAYIQVRRYESSPSRSRSRSRSRNRSRSLSVKRDRSKSRERPASNSPVKARSVSPVKSYRARSRSRSRSGSPDKAGSVSH